MRRGWLVLVAAGAVVCGKKAPPQAPADVAPTMTEEAPAEESEATPDPDALASCVSDCVAVYPNYKDEDGGYARYCEEMCDPYPGLNMDCSHHCQDSKKPGAYYDENGEYTEYEDERTEEQIADDQAACEAECEGVPTVSDITACATACSEAGEGSFESCQGWCDPDPYDDCVYQPCD